MFIVYLKNAEAARVAQTLRALLTGGGSDGGGAASRRQPAPPVAAGVAAGGREPARRPRRRPLGAGAASRRRRRFSAGGATIQADIANNALIIMAPEPVYNNLRAIIEKLDVRRAQVFVEALIVEVAADQAAEFGIQWQVLRRHQQRRARRASAAPTSAPAAAATTSSTARSTSAALGPGPEPRRHQRHGHDSRPRHRSPTSRSSRARSRRDVGANILSTPTLLTLDNEEARIIVGQNVPFVTGQYATTGSDADASRRSRPSSARTSASCCA